MTLLHLPRVTSGHPYGEKGLPTLLSGEMFAPRELHNQAGKAHQHSSASALFAVLTWLTFSWR